MSEKKESKYKVLTGWDDWADIILILKKGEETSTHRIKGQDWYFAIKTADFKKAGGEEKFKEVFNNKEELIEKFGSNGEFTLIYCKYTARNAAVSGIISKLKKMNIVAYESDLSRTKRYMIDKEVPIADNLNILYFDIETDDSTSKRIEIGRDKILSWAAYDNKGKSWYDDTADEKTLIQNLIKLIDEHDVFVGWNSQKFDLPYILKRMEKYEIKYDWRKRIHLDLMKRCIKLYSYEMDKIGLTGFSLNEIARVFLGEAKILHAEGIKEMYDNNRELLEKYNRKDAELLLKLDSKLELTKLMINECVWTGTTLNRFFVGELLDNYMLRKSKKLQRYLLSRPSQAEAEANKTIHVIGGYVKPPITGLYTDVRIFDFKSLYPSMIVSWNIGQDSIDLEKTKLGDAAFNNFVGSDRKIEDVEFKEWFTFLMKQKKKIDPKNECYQTANNNFFRKDTNSFIASLIKELLELRSEMKKKLSGLQPGSPDYGSTRSAQAIVKELANSLYGITADRSSRYFNKNIAESITITGQFLNKASSEIIQQISGFATIYADTDSAFVPIPGTNDDIDTLTEKVNIRLKQSLNKAFSLTTNIVHLEYEKAYRKMIMVDKKRYSGTMMWLNSQKTDMIFSKGLEDVKKNTIGITKRAMRELSKMITFEDRELEHIRHWLEKLKKDIFDETLQVKKEDLVISTRISKPTYKYVTKSAHILLAEKMVEKGLILQPSEEADAWGTRIDYVISEATPKQIATHIDDFDGKWDRRYYWDTQIYGPIFRILQIVWPAEDWAQYSLAEQERKVRELEKLRKKEENERLAKERVQKKIEREAASKLRKEERTKLLEERAKQKLEKETERIKREEERLNMKKEREEARKKRQEEYDKRKLERDLKKQSKAKQLTLNL